MREKSCVGRAEGVTVVRHSRSTKAERMLESHLKGGIKQSKEADHGGM